MWQDYVTRGHSLSYERYRLALHQENVVFGMPTSDVCEVCLDQVDFEDGEPNDDTKLSDIVLLTLTADEAVKVTQVLDAGGMQHFLLAYTCKQT